MGEKGPVGSRAARPGFAARVLVRWSSPAGYSSTGKSLIPLRNDSTGEFEVSTPDEQVGALNGQGGGDVAATGTDAGEPSGADPEQQGIEVEHDGQAELEGSHPLTVHQHADRGPVVQRDFV